MAEVVLCFDGGLDDFVAWRNGTDDLASLKWCCHCLVFRLDDLAWSLWSLWCSTTHDRRHTAAAYFLGDKPSSERVLHECECVVLCVLCALCALCAGCLFCLPFFHTSNATAVPRAETSAARLWQLRLPDSQLMQLAAVRTALQRLHRCN